MSVPVPRLLLTLALDALPERVAELIESGEKPADYVWAFFDGRVRPGRAIAMMHLRNGEVSPVQAARRVDAAIKEARGKGTIFAFGIMTTPLGLVELLERMGGDAGGLGSIRSWAMEPLPRGGFRVSVIAGVTTQLQLCSLDVLGG